MSIKAEAASIEAKNALQRDSRNVVALIHVAYEFLSLGNKAAAQEHAALAVEQGTATHVTLRNASGIMDAVGDRAAAIRLAQRAVSEVPSLSEYRLHLGALLIAESRFREAAEHLAVHVSLPESTGLGHRLLSSALFNCGQRDLAIKAIQKGLTVQPDDIDSIMHHAWLMTAGGNYSDGLIELQHAVEVAPGNSDAWRALSGVQEMLGAMEDAMASAEKAVELRPESRELSDHRAHIAQMCGLLVATSDDLPDTSEWAIPTRRRNRPQIERKQKKLNEMVLRRWEVLYAIMLRTIRTRYGHTRLGYFWAVMEPISHLATLGSVFFLLNHAPPPVGNNLFLYYITGLLPYLMFSHLGTELMVSVHSNNSLVMLPVINRFDIMIATSLLQLATELIVGVMIFLLSGAFGEQGMPSDPLTVFYSILPLWIMSTGIGILNAVIYEFMSSWESFFNSIVRLLYFASGIYYSPIAMPDFVRNILEWNPVLQCIEYFRSGFYAQYNPHWLKVDYIYTWAFLAIVLGLAAERATRNKMRIIV